MTKKELRKVFKERRSLLDSDQIVHLQSQLEKKFLDIHLPDCRMVHSYIPLFQNNEPDPLPIIRQWKYRCPALQWCAPVSNPSNFTMLHLRIDEHTEYTKNVWGIQEPMTGETINIQSIDAAFVPLLAFDKNGQRVGYGKGFYDRFLSEAPREMLKIGLSFFSPVDGIDDIDFFDKKLDFCITPDQVYAF